MAIIKKLFIAFVAVLSANFVQAQQPYPAFAELLGYQKGLFSNKVTVTVDFGQATSFWKSTKESKIVDDNGQDIVFNSMVDAMNYMSKRGWKFLQAYVVTEGNQNSYHWLMSKQITDDSQITEGFNIRATFTGQPKPCYIITYLKRISTTQNWDVVKEERKCDLNSDELNSLMQEWRGQSNDQYIYECRVKKE